MLREHNSKAKYTEGKNFSSSVVQVDFKTCGKGSSLNVVLMILVEPYINTSLTSSLMAWCPVVSPYKLKRKAASRWHLIIMKKMLYGTWVDT